MMSFKPNPKAQVVITFTKLFGKEIKPTVNGRRLTTDECRRHSCPRDTYLAELVVDGETVASAKSLDWRKAYKLLAIATENLYAEGMSLV